MCIVIIKEAGASFPSKSTLKTCFNSNPHGAGFMYSQGGKVIISKGYMGFRKFWKNYQALSLDVSQSVVYHFRIATAGSVVPANTHPFPVSDCSEDLKSLDVITDLAMAHNGVISIQPKEKMSDTMTFVRDVMSPLKHLLMDRNEAIFNLMEMSTRGSEIALLYGDGSVVSFGSGWLFEKETGLWFSNDSYLDDLWGGDDFWYKLGKEKQKSDRWYDESGYGEKIEDESFQKCDLCGEYIDKWGNEYYCERCDIVIQKH